MLMAVRRLIDVGCKPMLHIAARRIASRQALERCVGQLAEEADVDDCVVVGGGVPISVGLYESAIEILETGALHRFCIKDVAVAGHLEGSPDIPGTSVMDALRQKHAFAKETALRLRIMIDATHLKAHRTAAILLKKGMFPVVSGEPTVG